MRERNPFLDADGNPIKGEEYLAAAYERGRIVGEANERIFLVGLAVLSVVLVITSVLAWWSSMP